MFLQFGHRSRVAIKKVPHGSIPSDQNNLLKRTAGAAFFEQPEKAFDGDINHTIGSFLAGSAMNNVRDPLHGFTHSVAVRDVSPDQIEPRLRFREAVMAKRANRYVLMVLGLEDAVNEMCTHLARRTGH